MKQLNEIHRINKTMHLDHLEDQALTQGMEGARDSVYFLRGLRDMLSSHVKAGVFVTEPWDGGPYVMVGPSPKSGQFFLAHSGKFNYSEADIDQNYEPGLAKRLKVAFKYLQELDYPRPFGGQILFVKSDLHAAIINGEEVVLFQPNKTVYTVPALTTLAKNIQQAQVGIVFDREYDENFKPKYQPNVASLKPSKDVWYRDATLVDASGTATFTEDELNYVNHWIEIAEERFNSMDQKVIDYISQNSKYKDQILNYIDNHPYDMDFNKLLIGVTMALNQSIIDARHGDTSRKRQIEKTEVLNFYKKNFLVIINLLAFVNAVRAAKEAIVRKLTQVKSLGMFTKTSDGLKVTHAPGFIATDRRGINVKLVDRLRFPTGDFNTTKNWDQ